MAKCFCGILPTDIILLLLQKILKLMKEHLDIFLPKVDEEWAETLKEQVLSGTLVLNVFSTEAVRSSEALRQIAAQTQAPYVALVVKDTAIQLGEAALERMVKVAQDSGAAMVYADRYEKKRVGDDWQTEKHPVIDYQLGAIRDDFDFGALWLLKGDLLRQWAHETANTQYKYGGLYDLRLYLSRQGELLHLNEMLYTEVERDMRASGEKQFDYVNPANREVQIEMEQVATRHLDAIGALVDTNSLLTVDYNEQPFDFEASVIIPVFNRAKTIADAVKSALEQETSFAYNVIVVDNHSTDGTADILSSLSQSHSDKLHVLNPDRTDLGIGGCWNMAVNDSRCGRFAVQLDSDDLYSSPKTLQTIVDAFYEQKAAMMVGSYRMCDFDLNTLPPGLIDQAPITPCVSMVLELLVPSSRLCCARCSCPIPAMVKTMPWVCGSRAIIALGVSLTNSTFVVDGVVIAMRL